MRIQRNGRDPQPPSRATRALQPIAILVFALSLAPRTARAEDKTTPKPPADVIVFTNGDRLTGALERGVGDSVVFKSDVAGEITVSLDKVKEMHSASSFAVLRKDVPASRKNVVPGTLIYADSKLTVAAPAAAPETVPAKQIAYIIDKPTYNKELERTHGPLYGWYGAVNGGSTIVRATDSGTTYTAGISLARVIPAVPYLPARNRTTFNLQETYGKLTSPVIPQTTPPSPPSIALTNIFHTDAERDEYFSPRFFTLAQTSFDHNYSQGLDLAQIYGAGIGWTAIKNPHQQLDVKTTMQYVKQSYLASSTTPNTNLIGSTISETYHRNLPRRLLFTETLSVLPAWTETKDYSANGSASLVMPVFKRLSLTIATSDNFLNDPAVGYRKNSFQFVTAVSYSLR